MAFPNWLNNPDTNLFLSVNRNHSDYFDAFYALFTSMITWIPFYLLVLFLVFRKYNQYGFWVLIALVISTILSDQLSVLIKELVQRYRPSHEPALLGKVHLPIGAGGDYGFVSSHAANTFAFAFLMGSLSKNIRLFLLLIGWAIVTAYSRIYVGVHYPLDILGGAVLGGLIGWTAYKLLMLVDGRFQRKKIFYAGKWKNKEVQPALVSMLFIVVTLLMVSGLIGKYFIKP
jgi:undecaprenyl-diphosphatase